MSFVYNDGGTKGRNDCVPRAIAIVSGKDVREIKSQLKNLGLVKPNGRVLTTKKEFKDFMGSLGFRWTACMTIGSGCKVHLDPKELPNGKLICSVSRHYVAVIDGVVNDTHDSTRAGSRCVYGYWTK